MRENIIEIMKDVEPRYNGWPDDEINKQIDAIYECGYIWENNYKGCAFKHKKTGFYLNIAGLHFYTPEKIKETYKNVWSKDYHGVKLKHNFWKAVKGIPFLIISVIIGLIFFNTKTVLIINSLILIYIVYHFFKFKYHKKKKYEEIIQDVNNKYKTEEITWCVNCVNYKKVENWQSDKIYQVDVFDSYSLVPCQIFTKTIDLWRVFLKTPKGERFLYPKDCKSFIKK